MSAVTYSVTDGVAHIELNRPEAANTIDMGLARALGEAAVAAREDDGVRAVVLSGAGKRFCGGGDVSTFADSDDPSGYVHELATTADAGIHVLESMAKPVVSAVHGAVAGGGLGVMLSGDVVVAAEGTKFVFAYPAIGLTPDCGTSASLPRAMGQQRALAFALSGAALTSEQALAHGLVTEVAADPLTRAHELAATWAGGAAVAFGEARRLLRAGVTGSRQEIGRDEAGTISARSTSPEAQALFAQFLGR
ncbi:enoyl-CoA hydratase/isomerase family protein [Janibacter alittae]|uniref:Enoyl-CoA hydratase/isomerase family protein n=1 Tax=Janibacter alittae TaxID=3115209 RepID=A0ABZ2MHR8_9MICO